MRPVSAIKTIYGILSSRMCLIVLAVGWVAFYVLSSIWTKEAFAFFADDLSGNIVIQMPFVLFLISGTSNLIKACRGWRSKGLFGFISLTLLPLGLLIFLTGFFISIVNRQFDWIVAAKEHTFRPKWSSNAYTVANIKPGIKERFLDTDFGSEQGKGIFQFEPKVILLDSKGSTLEVGAFPSAKSDDTYFHILNFGLAPGARFLEGNDVKEEGYIPLRILAPGSSDSFELRPYNYKVIVSLEPERMIQKGNIESAEYTIKSPKYRFRIFDGEKIIAEEVSRDGISFDNHTVSIYDTTFWVQLEIVKDRAYPIILTGLFLILGGIVLAIIYGVYRLVN